MRAETASTFARFLGGSLASTLARRYSPAHEVSQPSLTPNRYRHVHGRDPVGTVPHGGSSAPARTGSSDGIVPWTRGRRRRSARRVPPVSRSRAPPRRARYGDG